jgi:hypothetical protein
MVRTGAGAADDLGEVGPGRGVQDGGALFGREAGSGAVEGGGEGFGSEAEMVARGRARGGGQEPRPGVEVLAASVAAGAVRVASEVEDLVGAQGLADQDDALRVVERRAAQVGIGEGWRGWR